MGAGVTFKTLQCGDILVKYDGKQFGLITFPSGEEMQDKWKIRFFVSTPSGYNPLVLNANFNSGNHCKRFIRVRIDDILDRYSIHFIDKVEK